MGRKSKTQQLTENILGQHLALAVAAHLARTQLVPDPLSVYDGQHITEMLDVVGTALARVAPLYVHEANSREPRQLMEADLEGARVRRSATLLVLNDGRTLSAVTMKRADLRQAIAILKTLGIPELAGARKPAEAPRSERHDRTAQLRAQLDEAQNLLRWPFVDAQVERANRLLVSIARNAPQGAVANLAMRLLSAVHDARSNGSEERQVGALLARLRDAVEEAERAGD